MRDAETTYNMVARRPTALLHLFDDSATKYEALTSVRNSIIGNKAAKEAFISAGVVPLILELLDSSSHASLAPETTADAKLLVNGAVTFGSLACSSCLSSSDLHIGFSHLVRMLCSTQSFLVKEGAARALKLVLQVIFMISLRYTVRHLIFHSQVLACSLANFAVGGS